jgi:putative hydrolase of HD superfamily
MYSEIFSRRQGLLSPWAWLHPEFPYRKPCFGIKIFMEPLPLSGPLGQQIAFLSELDKLKDILRQCVVAASRRNENSAEHSWHLAMMAVVLAEHAPAGVDHHRVLKMLLVHDIVEIDAGDTFLYDTQGQGAKAEKEKAAANRIFNLLPPMQAKELREIWDEFEAEATPEAKWAQGLDRMQALLQNLRTNGAAWTQHRITKSQVLERNKKIGNTMPEVWKALVGQIDWAESQGYLQAGN